MRYEIFNPTKARRVFYDGFANQNRIEIAPGDRRTVEIADHIATALMQTPDDLIVTVPQDRIAAPLRSDESRPIAHVIGHRGIGDTIHQRGPVKELICQGYEVYLETPGWVVFWDLLDKGLKLIHMPTGLHAQRRQIERERGTYSWHQKPSKIALSKRIYYNKAEIDRYGSIAQAMFPACGLPVPDKPDFTLPVKPEWRERAKQLIATWPLNGKPLLIHRPNTIRPEWMARVRNPDPRAYDELFKILRETFFVVSVGFLQGGVEWIEGPEQNADVKLHNGELATEDLIGLWAEANLVYSTAGFAPVMAQAVGTPSITVYGGSECWQITERAGEHLVPSLGIDPDRPCTCFNIRCSRNCNKQISIEPAIQRIKAFVAEHIGNKSRPALTAMREPPRAVEPEASKGDILIFGTFYVDSSDRDHLTELWIRLHTALNPECDFLAVDSQSPLHKFDDWTPYDGKRHRLMYWNFPDNIGHLSRRNVTAGNDGWGRAFTKGLEIAIELGYQHVMHIEGDSLFRLKVNDVVERMKREKANCFTTKVFGTGRNGMGWPGWVETGLMLFSTDYLKRSNFIARYDWPNRRVAPTPEVIVWNILGTAMSLQSWQAWRADKNQITKDNIEKLNLDWVTHQHNSDQQDVYRKFVDMALGERTVVPVVESTNNTRSVATPQPKPLIKLNLGCGTNKLPGWENHDADVDITKPLPWPDAVISHILIEHCVEHVGYHQAIAFFKEAWRVLSLGGILRVAVPSLEMIRKCDDGDYHKFTTKWQRIGPTKRGALHAIIYAHGHQMIWSASLLEAVLYFCGFDQIEQCEPGSSRHEVLRGVEGHGKVISDRFNKIESCVFEATKQGTLPVSFDHRVAVVVGGSVRVDQDIEAARALIKQYNLEAEWLITNDKIAEWGEGVAVTLHPDKLQIWLRTRAERGLPPPSEVWAHIQQHRNGVTHSCEDWRGSVGLFAVAVARKKGHDRILLCGVPMEMQQDHYIRKAHWGACAAFQAGWRHRLPELKHHVRSLSGYWTEELLGKPTPEWLGVKAKVAA